MTGVQTCALPISREYARVAGFDADEAKQKLFLREEKDFALPRLFLFWDGASAAQEGAGGMRGGFFDLPILDNDTEIV